MVTLMQPHSLKSLTQIFDNNNKTKTNHYKNDTKNLDFHEIFMQVRKYVDKLPQNITKQNKKKSMKQNAKG